MITLDFTNIWIHALNGRATGSRISVSHCESAPLLAYIPPDRDTAAEEKTAQALRELLSHKGFSGNAVTVLFSESRVVSNEYELPYDKNEAAMSNMVRGEISETGFFDHHVMDYTVLSTFPKNGSTFCKVQVHLTSKQLVDFAQRVITLAGKKPVCYTVAQNCLYHLQHLSSGGRYGNHFIAANMGSSNVHVSLMGGGDTGAVTRMEAVMPGEQAFADMRAHSYDSAAALAVATEQISKMIQYLSIKQPGKEADAIFLLGDMASREMADKVSSSLGLPVVLAQKPEEMTAPDDFAFERYAYAACALLEK